MTGCYHFVTFLLPKKGAFLDHMVYNMGNGVGGKNESINYSDLFIVCIVLIW
jgi:hypothetical protein